MDVLRVAACQVRLAVGALASNRAACLDAVEEAVGRGARLVVLPELATSGYVFTGADEARRLAEPVDGPTVAGWRDASRRAGIVLVGGLCELDADGVLRNSAVVVDRGEVVAVYRKAHLWHDEVDVFTPGDAAPPVVATSVGRVGVLVCYDLEFPEWVRLPVLAGADVLAVPTNWPREAGSALEPLEVLNARAMARANKVAVVAADRCGAERGVEWVGGAGVVAATGHLLAGGRPSPAASVHVADVDLDASRDKAVGPRNDALADRRPHLYGPVAQPFPADRP